jgi:uncharacterized protein (TIGR02147 family)
MTIFDYETYKDFVNNSISLKGKSGRGEYKRISGFLGVSSVLISQIFKGEKEVSLEQAIKLGEYYGLTVLENKYLICLVSAARAGSHSLKKFYAKEAQLLIKKSKDIGSRISHSETLSEHDKAIFYSDYKYSAIRLACSLDGLSKMKMAAMFDLTEDGLGLYLDFLKSRGLIKEEKGHLFLGPSSTHISKSSPFVKHHHRNWRLQSIGSLDQLGDHEVIYTAPMCISKNLFEKLNTKILGFIDDLVVDAVDSESEELCYINIDLRKL